MHASCYRYQETGRSAEEVVDLGRRLAGRLSQLPGFVWFLVLDAGGGALVSVSVYETAADLARAESVTGEWLAGQRALMPLPALTTLVDTCSGEVLVQRGL